MKIFSVSELAQTLKQHLEGTYQDIKVEGEISNISQPASGHIYFSIKDSTAVIRCCWFKNYQNYKRVTIDAGMSVVVSGTVSLYYARGDVQLIAKNVEFTREGILRKNFEDLKIKLQNEGLFSFATKKKIPEFPKKIGIITSLSTAALQDILTTIKHRFTACDVIIYPTLVQGEKAPNEIVTALSLAQNHAKVDTLIIARGGGSLEDLMAFNTESVARAIWKSKIPTICGIGHESDVTIADFVCDHRSATPTAAAEQATPDPHRTAQMFLSIKNRLYKNATHHIQFWQQKTDFLSGYFNSQTQSLNRHRDTLTQITRNLMQPLKWKLKDTRQELIRYDESIYQSIRQNGLLKAKQRQQKKYDQLYDLVDNNIMKKKHALQPLRIKLVSLNPKDTMARGYAIVSKENGSIVSDANTLSLGDKLNLTFHKTKATVKTIPNDNEVSD